MYADDNGGQEDVASTVRLMKSVAVVQRDNKRQKQRHQTVKCGGEGSC